jgi:hypothetical protein
VRPRVVLPAVAAGALVVVAAVTAAFSRSPLGTGEPWTFDRRGDRDTSLPSPVPEADEPTSRQLPDAFFWGLGAVVFLLMLLLLVLVAVAVWNHRRGRTVRMRRRLAATRRVVTGRKGRSDEPALVAAVDGSLAALATGDEPRAVVIACWLRLQELATAAGVSARAADTADDLVLRLLRLHRVSEEVLVDLADVYRRARYSPHPVDEGMSQTASAALRQLRQALVDPPVGARSGHPE